MNIDYIIIAISIYIVYSVAKLHDSLNVVKNGSFIIKAVCKIYTVEHVNTDDVIKYITTSSEADNQFMPLRELEYTEQFQADTPPINGAYIRGLKLGHNGRKIENIEIINFASRETSKYVIYLEPIYFPYSRIDNYLKEYFSELTPTHDISLFEEDEILKLLSNENR